MTLKAYLEMAGLKPPAFARLIGVTPQAVRYWIRGERRPSIEHMHQIAAATDRAVRIADWVGEE